MSKPTSLHIVYAVLTLGAALGVTVGYCIAMTWLRG